MSTTKAPDKPILAAYHLGYPRMDDSNVEHEDEVGQPYFDHDDDPPTIIKVYGAITVDESGEEIPVSHIESVLEDPINRRLVINGYELTADELARGWVDLDEIEAERVAS